MYGVIFKSDAHELDQQCSTMAARMRELAIN